MNKKVWPIVAIVEAIVLLPGVAWAAAASFTSATSVAAVTGTSSYAAGKGVYGHATSTSASTHYGVFGATSGTGGIGVYGQGAKNGVYSAGNLGVATGKVLACAKCVTTGDLGVLPAVGVYNPSGTDVSMSDSTNTTITFSTEQFDTANMHSTTTNTSRLVAPVNGLYSVNGNLDFSQSGTGNRFLFILKNGTIVQTVSALPLGNHDTLMGISALLPMNAGDYVELQAYQGSGTTQSAVGCNPAGACPRFTMNFASPLP